MADYIASVDAGNGGTNVILAKENGGYKNYYEPSVRAMATGGGLALGEKFELQYDYVDWYGNRYVTGDDVVRVTRRGLERHTGSQRYGEEFHRFLVAVGLAKIGIKQGTVDLTLFAPPGLYKEAKQNILEGFLKNGDEVQIRLRSDKKARTWRYETVTVWPEGIGAAACFMIDDEGKSANPDVFDGEIVILDSGAFSLDAVKLINGSFDAEGLEHATWENAGVNTHIREPLLRKIHAQGDDFKITTVDDVDMVIRQGLASGNYTLKVAGYEMNLQPLCERYFERYADWVSNNICDGVFNSFRGIKSVILVGGGAVMIEKKLHELYPGKILDRKKYPSTRKIHPVDMNAVGGLRIALMNRRHTELT